MDKRCLMNHPVY